MDLAIGQTNRRREDQTVWNLDHEITPESMEEGGGR